VISSRRATSFAAAWVLAVAGLVAAPGAIAEAGPQADRKGGHHSSKCHSSKPSVARLLKCVTLKGVMQHERAFQRIADNNDGTRSAATPGYDASARYVKRRMERAGYRVTVQEFDVYAFSEVGPSQLQQTAPTPTTYVEGTDFAATPQSEPGDVTAAVTPVDIQLGLGNTSTSGCEAADFVGFPAGNIALIQRGTCTFEIKAENAAAAGAVGVLFFNQGNTDAADRQGIPAVTLSNDYTGGIPALSATYALGAQLSAVPGLTMRLFANVSRVKSVTTNVLAESRRGDDSNVVMAGAHLDSVPEGPGINDNGSGSSALLEVAEQMRKVKPKNTLRFAWWGAEEAGLVGSTYYVNDLLANAPEDLAAIEMYLNFDMVASPNYGLFRYDGDGSDFGLVGPDGSDEIEALFARYYSERGIPSEASPFNGRSDYQAFINNGIPAGGLFTGAEGVKTPEQQAKWGGTAGIAYDPCYHQACDTIANVSRKALRINADAIAYVVYLFASRKEVINEDAVRTRGTRSAGPFA
jgi:Zn-dependent M28 family amino/carboxypeptidase